MTTTNKAFNNIFNTTQEDQKVAKVLSGWEAKAAVPFADLASFDSLTLMKVEELQTRLFACCNNLQRKRYNLQPAVRDILCAYLIIGYPELKAMRPNSPLVDRVESALQAAGVTYEDMLAWSIHLSDTKAPEVASSSTLDDTEHVQVMQHEGAMISELIELNKALATRVKTVETRLAVSNGDLATVAASTTIAVSDQNQNSPEPQRTKRRKGANTNLVDIWYAWFTGALQPAMVTRLKRSDTRLLVAFMRLFIGGYRLDPRPADFRDAALHYGTAASENILAFVGKHGVNARSAGTTLTALRKLHKAGVLNAEIDAYRQRLGAGLSEDPSAPTTLGILLAEPTTDKFVPTAGCLAASFAC